MERCYIDRLLAFGFCEIESGYEYVQKIIDGHMVMIVNVGFDGAIRTRVIDCLSGEEYVLHRIPSAEGSFVGRVRSEHDALLDEIRAKCFGTTVFKNFQTQAVLEYVRNTYGDDPEFLWERTPQNAIVRRKDNQKWYLALLTVSRQKLGMDSPESVEIIDLRMNPDEVPKTVDRIHYFPGFHMNKKHWITILLDGIVPLKEICGRIDDSYRLAKK